MKICKTMDLVAAKELNSKKGFTVLFAVLISGLLLAVGLGILNIALKESILSSLLRESQFAVYAADSGIDCVLYHDFNSSAFSPEPAGASLISCAGGNVVRPYTEDVASVGGEALGDPSKFMISFGGGLPYCTIVEVIKYDAGSVPAFGVSCPEGICTLVISRGYNTCDLNNPRRVERAFRVLY
jgi:hypothetical protein